jgi:3-methyl-2-oxobutanoate hydroxymethyltransferase
VLDDALALQAAGCFSIVFEAIPAEVTNTIMPYLEILVIGIGAGPSTDGQVLVLHDLLAIHDDFKPKFAKRFAAVKAEMLRGVEAYADEVRTRRFPGPEHTYGIAPEELDRFRAEMGDLRQHARR